MKKSSLVVFALLATIASFAQVAALKSFSITKGQNEFSGVKDGSGKVIVPATFYNIKIIDDYILANDSKAVSYFNKHGVLLAKYCDIKPFSYEVSIVKVCKDGMGYDALINKDGKVLTAPNKYIIEPFSNIGLFRISPSSGDELYGLIDTSGQVLAECKYGYIGDSIGDGLVAFTLNDKFGFLSSTGEVVIQPIYDYAGPFNNGKAKVNVSGSKPRSFYIDTSGNEVP